MCCSIRAVSSSHYRWPSSRWNYFIGRTLGTREEDDFSGTNMSPTADFIILLYKRHWYIIYSSIVYSYNQITQWKSIHTVSETDVPKRPTIIMKLKIHSKNKFKRKDSLIRVVTLKKDVMSIVYFIWASYYLIIILILVDKY